jgi:hypothetical protein
MCGYRNIVLAILYCLLAACSGEKPLTNVSAGINTASLPLIDTAVRHMWGDKLLPLDRAVLYKTTFQRRYIESENVLEPAILHDSSVMKTIEYFPNIDGARQDLYLLELPAASGNLFYVYFSLWFNTDASQMRFGPAYLGKYNKPYSNIQFNRDIVTKGDGSILSFKPKKKGRSFVFVIDRKINEGDNRRIEVNKIVLTEANKIGGTKKFLFNIPNSRLEQLIFSCADTIQLH